MSLVGHRRPVNCLAARWRARAWCVLVLFTVCTSPAATQAASRVALVLAAEQYTLLTKSPLRVDTVKVVAEALARQGFEVIVSENPSNAGARAALREFTQKAAGADHALVVMSGHGVTSAGLMYFLPVNVEITQETDLFSRSLALPSFVQATGKAKSGAVLFIMSVPNLASTMQGISYRPTYGGALEKNTLIAVSTSDKVPVSRIDAISQQALADLATAAKEPQLKLAGLVAATIVGGVGRIFGEVGDVSLTPPKVAKPPVPAEPVPPPAPVLAPVPVPAPVQEVDVAALQLVEGMIGNPQRLVIQTRLRDLGHYNGPIDAVFGDMTRQAIRDYQKSVGSPPTGFLSPAQLQTLLKK